MAKSGYEPYILPSVSVSKSRIRVCLRQDLYAEFCICILFFTHPSKWHVGCTLHSASVSCFCILYLGRDPHPVSRIPYPYPVFGAHSVSRIPYPVSVSCIWGAFCALSHVSCFFCPVLGCALYFASCGLGRIPYPVSRIRIPYRGGLNILSSYLCIQGGEEIVKQLQQLLGLLPMLVLSMLA